MSYNLFLDDERTPLEAFKLTGYKPLKFLDWVVVKDYVEFRNVLVARGVPNIVCFDHDLKPEHYTPSQYWNCYGSSKSYQERKYPHYEFQTGKHCAELLKYYCDMHQKPLPTYFVHSQNPVGKDWIIEVLKKV